MSSKAGASRVPEKVFGQFDLNFWLFSVSGLRDLS